MFLNTRLFKSSVSLIAVAAFMAPATAAIAQDVDEIIVTARKKEETLLDAPLAISAFTGVELQEAGLTDIVEITKAAPGVFVEANNQSFARVNTTPRFRGVFLSTDNRLQQTATVFLDGVYMSGGAQTIGVNELQQVEIIKGPQSALFGRNTFAGAINYITKDPSEDFRADIDLTVASRGEFRGSAGIEGGIANGISGRIGGMFESVDGHYDNIAVDGQRLGDEEQWSVNGTLLVEPSENFRVKLRGSYREVDDGAPAAQATHGIEDHNFGGFLIENGLGNLADRIVPSPLGSGRTESVYRGTIVTPAEDTIGLNSGADTIQRFRDGLVADGRNSTDDAINFFEYNPFNVDEFGLKLDSLRLSANAEFDVSEDMTFTVLGGYNEEAYGYWSDFDLTEDDSFDSFITSEIDDFSLEGRLSGSALNDALDWTVGASYTDIEITSLSGTANFLFFPIYFGDVFRTDPFVTGAQTSGVFASLDYQFTDKWSLTLEGRYQEDRISEDEVNALLPDDLSPATITNFLPRATLRFEPTSNTTLYANYSEGNLPGGFNPEVASLDATQLAELEALAPGASAVFGEESLENFEFGWKQTALDGRLGFNVAAFYMKRSDEIVRSIELVTDTSPNAPNPFRTVAFNTNGASTDITGVEIDGALDLSDHFSMLGSFAYVDAKIDSFPEGAGTGDFGDIFGQEANVAGQVAPRFPPFSGSFGAKLERPFNGFGEFDNWFLRGDVFHTGNYWASNANVAETDTATDVNVRLGIKGEDMSIEAFVTNLFNEDAPAAANNFADISFDTRLRPEGFFDFSREGIQVALRDKRQVGVRAKYTFK